MNIARTHKHKFPWEKQIVGKSHIQGQFPNKQSLPYNPNLKLTLTLKSNRNFDEKFVYIYISNNTVFPGVRKVFLCFEIYKIF